MTVKTELTAPSFWLVSGGRFPHNGEIVNRLQAGSTGARSDDPFY